MEAAAEVLAAWELTVAAERAEQHGEDTARLGVLRVGKEEHAAK